MKAIGKLGEELVSSWLETQNCQILARNWTCRWGEIDLIVRDLARDSLAFVEVKTRRDRNWDEDGKIAIDSAKQAKLIETASLYLAKYPQLAESPCRFDVALVRYQKRSLHKTVIPLDRSLKIDDEYELVLQEYLYNAFDLT
jgi:putative endonuclease